MVLSNFLLTVCLNNHDCSNYLCCVLIVLVTNHISYFYLSVLLCNTLLQQQLLRLPHLACSCQYLTLIVLNRVQIHFTYSNHLYQGLCPHSRFELKISTSSQLTKSFQIPAFLANQIEVFHHSFACTSRILTPDNLFRTETLKHICISFP